MIGMKLAKETRKLLVQIYSKQEEIETLFNKISAEDQDNIYEFHAENYSLNHCIRWGLQASENLLTIERRI